MSFTRVSARFTWPSADLLEGGGTGPKRPGPERGTTGTLTISTPYIRPETLAGKGSFAGAPHWRNGNTLNAQVPLTEAALNELKKGLEGSGFVTPRAITIVSALACVTFCGSVGIAGEGNVSARALPTPAEAPTVATDMRIGGDEKQTRFVIDLNRKIDLAAFTLADPYRVVLDLPQVTFKLPAKATEQARGLVKAFRYGLIMQGGSRVVLDTKAPVRIEKAFVLDAAEG
jgi:hypothetical protein